MWQPTIVLPSWHLEDLARETDEAIAAQFLNAYAVAFHPLMLAASGQIPTWKAAPALDTSDGEEIYLIPEASRSKISSDWSVNQPDAVVFEISSNRASSLEEVSNDERLQQRAAERISLELGIHNEGDPWPLQDEFVALGTLFLLNSLLSQHMYHYENVQETRFEELLIRAAELVIQGDEAAATESFWEAVEQLQESREKFYSYDAHFVELCLFSKGITADQASALGQAGHSIQIMASGNEWETLKETKPEVVEILKNLVSEEKLIPMGGEWENAPTPLLPLPALRWQFERGISATKEVLGLAPEIWGRGPFGLTSQIPLMLKKFKYSAAYHIAMDSGYFPEEEQSHFSWESRSGIVVPATSRLPVSVDSARSLLRIPERLSEAMNHDHVSLTVLARWPQLKNPWYHDLIRIHHRVPVLGKFTSLTSFFEETDDSGHNVEYEQRDYQTPVLEQLTSLGATNPTERFAEHWRCSSLLSSYSGLSSLLGLMRVTNDLTSAEEFETRLMESVSELKSKDAPDLQVEMVTSLKQQQQEAARALAKKLQSASADSNGFLFFNPCSQSRMAVISLGTRSTQKYLPKVEGNVKAIQVDEDDVNVLVDLPTWGFVTSQGVPASQVTSSAFKVPLAGELFLQSEHFHAQIDPESGAIQRLRQHGSKETLLSARLVYRLDGESGAVARSASGWGDAPLEPRYTRMVADEIVTTKTGPILGEIQVNGRLLHSERDEVVAQFKVTYRSYRGANNLEVETELEPATLPSASFDRSYYAWRFAWAAAGATVKGNAQHSEFNTHEGFVESPGPFHIDDGEFSLTLFSDYRPFHRRNGMRMMDSILISNGDQQRNFKTQIGVQESHPARFAVRCSVSPQVVNEIGISKSQAAWLLHLDAPSISLIGMRRDPEFQEEGKDAYLLDLIETEGRHVGAKMRLFRNPIAAYELNFVGEVTQPLDVEGDTIRVEFQPADYLRLRVVVGS